VARVDRHSTAIYDLLKRRDARRPGGLELNIDGTYVFEPFGQKRYELVGFSYGEETFLHPSRSLDKTEPADKSSVGVEYPAKGCLFGRTAKTHRPGGGTFALCYNGDAAWLPLKPMISTTRRNRSRSRKLVPNGAVGRKPGWRETPALASFATPCFGVSYLNSVYIQEPEGAMS
jgi:hypothetical protein